MSDQERGVDTAPQVQGCVSGPAGKRETGDDDQSWLWPGAKVQPQCKLASGDKKQSGHQTVGRCNTLAIWQFQTALHHASLCTAHQNLFLLLFEFYLKYRHALGSADIQRARQKTVFSYHQRMLFIPFLLKPTKAV